MPAALSPSVDKPNRVYERLRELIVRGRLAAGARVVEADVAHRLGVSRTPAREAIQRLLQEGLIVAASPGRRTEGVVAPLTSEDVRDLYLIMASLEGAAVLAVDELEPAAQRALASELRDLENAFEREARARTIDFDRLFETHNAFHERLVRVSTRRHLRSMLNVVRAQVDRYEWAYAPMVGPDYSVTFEEHAEIIQAVRHRSGRRAQRAVAANWERGAERLAAVIDRVGARGAW